jgi:myo-inositol catabolism protein IolC
MDDEAATNDVAERYERLIRLWRETRAAARS